MKLSLVSLFLLLLIALYAGGCISDDSAGNANIQIKVDSPDGWMGAIGNGGNVHSISGSGTEIFDVQNPHGEVWVKAQKSGGGILTVYILKNGEVVANESTDAPFGVAQTSIYL
jgi:hypothetical protein